MTIIHRNIENTVLKALEVFPAVYINGPRQAGKTTLVKDILSNRFKGTFITFDDALERSAAIRNPLNYLKQTGYPIIIDEVQMVPEIFRPLKMLIDEQRSAALNDTIKPTGHYLLTGSANLMVIPQLADAMVGRMATITLLPLSAGEVSNSKLNFIESCFNKHFGGIKKDDTPIYEVIERATFPEIINISDEFKQNWFQNYVRKVTLEDPLHIYNLEKAEYMPALLQALAIRTGNLVNDADLSRDTGLTPVTARTYRNVLNGTFITNYLSPWYRNISKRLVKSGKIYFYDTMLLSYLLKSTPKEMAKANPQRFGHLLENFILSEFVKLNNALSEQVNISFYRTRDGKEVDFILEKDSKLVAIEVNNAENITEKDLSGLREFKEIAGKDFVCGVILCNTQRVISYDEDIYLVPISILWS